MDLRTALAAAIKATGADPSEVTSLSYYVQQNWVDVQTPRGGTRIVLPPVPKKTAAKKA